MMANTKKKMSDFSHLYKIDYLDDNFMVISSYVYLSSVDAHQEFARAKAAKSRVVLYQIRGKDFGLESA